MGKKLFRRRTRKEILELDRRAREVGLHDQYAEVLKKMPKSAKRVAAGKRAWAKLSAATKAKRISVLKAYRRGRSPKAASNSTRSTTKGGKRMGKRKKGGGGSRKQGLVSWLTSIFALLIGLGPVWAALKALFTGADPMVVGDQLQSFYNPLKGDKAALMAGYGSLIGGLIFKIASSELTKRAKIRSLIPALHA